MKYLLCLFVLLAPALCLSQDVLLNEGFEGDLSAWSVPGFGVQVADPLDPGNQVLSFTSTDDSGNMFSNAFPVDASTTYVLSFRYLGTAGGGNSGGMLWLLDPLYGNIASCPVWGTAVENSHYQLVDDGQWHTYELEFLVTDFFNPIGGTLQITCEDWNGAAGGDWAPPDVAGDAFFDDIQLYELGASAADSETFGSLKALYR